MFTLFTIYGCLYDTEIHQLFRNKKVQILSKICTKEIFVFSKKYTLPIALQTLHLIPLVKVEPIITVCFI